MYHVAVRPDARPQVFLLRVCVREKERERECVCVYVCVSVCVGERERECVCDREIVRKFRYKSRR